MPNPRPTPEQTAAIEAWPGFAESSALVQLVLAGDPHAAADLIETWDADTTGAVALILAMAVRDAATETPR
jgi:hypothetical protein